MRRIATVAMIGLMASAGTAQPDFQRVPRPSRSTGDGLCRHAPTLAPLPAESAVEQSDQRRRGYADKSMPTAAAPADSDGVRDVVVTGSLARESVPLPPPSPPAPVEVMPSTPSPVIAPDTAMAAPAPPADGSDESRRSRDGVARLQSGILTAGEHDDLLNPELYASYVRRSDLGQRWRTLPLVDTGRALTVAVTDASGRPMPMADVVLTCADGNSLSLRTLADGTAVFFPGLDRLGEAVRLSVRADGRTIAADRHVLIPASAGPQRITVTAAGQARAFRKFDLMLVLDTTGSMGDEIAYLKAELRSILLAIRAVHPDLDIRVGLVFYRDLGDDYVTLSVPFSGDVDAAQAQLARQYAGGGGDYPEAVDQAMNRAVNDFQWRPDAVKSMLWVADAPPHDERVGPSWAAAELARARRIQIVPVAASGVASEAEYIMRAMAAATQSRYLFLTDDSGVGLPHARPAIDCYLVTRLDALVRRVLDSQISGRRIEPRGDEVIRSVGRYDAGKCVLPSGRDWQQEG